MTLADSFGRTGTDLRVSLTDRCGLRCTYCMPAEGLPWIPQSEVLSQSELVRLVDVLVGEGVRSVRLTGGEPLLRPDAVDIVRALAGLEPRLELSMTTNGVALASVATGLADAGLGRVNVSLDTLRPETFRDLTRRDRLPDVLAGLAAAKAAGLEPVKVNTVLMRGVNDDEAGDLLAFCIEHGYQLRFIEQMPLEPQHIWDRSELVSAADILERLSGRFSLRAADRPGAAPAEEWVVDGQFRVGIVASVTRPFCSTCNRLRLTADGQLRNCLFSRNETDLRTPLRDGASDAELAGMARATMAAKAAGHGINDPLFVRPVRPMSAIGG